MEYSKRQPSNLEKTKSHHSCGPGAGKEGAPRMIYAGGASAGVGLGAVIGVQEQAKKEPPA